MASTAHAIAPYELDEVSGMPDVHCLLRFHDVLVQNGKCGVGLGSRCRADSLPDISKMATGLTFSTLHRAMSTATSEVATFANGCFWGTEHMFRKHYGGKGLIDAKVGFIGGTKADPTYMEVCSGQTGDAEASQLTFEPVRIHV